jgi:cell division protein FtsI (penicillin-binding protein 3)
MEHPVDARAAKRVLLVGRIAFVWAVLIVARLAYLQVYRHEDFQRAARNQHQHQLEIPADRGEVLDATGRPLAISVRTESVVVNPQRIKDPDFFASMLAGPLSLDAKELAAKVREYQERSGKKGRGRGFLRVKRHITADEKYRLQPLQRTFPFEIVRDQRREYPLGVTAAHVIGSLDAEGNGNAGIEQKLNTELTGKPGLMTVLTGSQQDSYVSWVSQESVQGMNLQLSVNSIIQADAEDFLAEGVAEGMASSGSVVVMDPQTGGILALANYPNFDPRHEVPTEKEAAARHSNIAVQIPSEPGSVMKMITVTMGIDSGKFQPETPIYCENGSFPRPNRRPIHDLHGMGLIDTATVLIKSSNIGVAKISIAAGPKMLYEYLKKFGIGDRTGIELPAETRGILRRQECDGKSDRNCWDAASHEYIAFGHEVAATGVQLARAVCVIANGGMLVQPHLVVKKTRPREDGKLETVPVDFSAPKRVIKPETTFTIRRIMERVILEGTGRRAAVPGYSSGGKTGSAEINENGVWLKHLHNSAFIGFAPVINPRVVVVVTLNRTPKQGGIAAAPVFSKVTQTALRVLQVPKDRPETDEGPKKPQLLETNELPENRIAQVAPAPAAPPAPVLPPPPSPLLFGPKVPDFRGKAVLAVLRESAALGLPVEIVGRGKAKVQKPEPGTILPNGGRVQVEFTSAP